MTTPNKIKYGMDMPKEVLVTRDPTYTHPAIVQGNYVGPKPHNYLPLAIICTVINPLVGPIAILFAVMSDRSYASGDLRYATKWSSYAFFTCIVSIIVSTVLGIAIGFSLSRIGQRGGYYW
ncbi:uncharacterized protein LOC135468914 [Liolophura sinensis]|uniref:uncharacterized protein LOC135468914 n=1 Tax=Liolophura sinensis TaxID=3198878 RepID=UPI003158EF30